MSSKYASYHPLPFERPSNPISPQFNFYDHSKLILSSNGLLITHIDKSYQLSRWHLQDVMSFSLNPPASASEEERKFNQKLVDKLKYCKEVLVSIKSASGGEEEGSGEKEREAAPREREGAGREAGRDVRETGRDAGREPRERGTATLNKRVSRMALR